MKRSAWPWTARHGARACRWLIGHRFLLTGLLLPSGAAAQSLLAVEGLGILAESLDARSRALGGAGVGLSGSYLLAGDPAAGAGIAFSTATATVQTSTTTLTSGGTAGFTRFPAVAAMYPYRGNVFSIQLGSFLDQEFEIRSEGTLDLGGIGVDIEDRFTSTGSVGRVGVGWARSVFEEFALGVSFGSYVGTTERVFRRSLDPEDVGAGVEPFEVGGRLGASGVFLDVGARWDPNALVRISASVSWSDDLVLAPTGESAGEKGIYRIPLELRAGGTVGLTAGLALHLGTTYADWSDTGSDLHQGVSRAGTLSYGGGLEWMGGTFTGRTIPFRIGARHRDLPFHSGGAPASERTLSGGIGINLADLDEQPLARLELGVERGSREAGSISEDFWRTTVSIRVASG